MDNLCGATKEDAICTLRTEEINGKQTHYGPSHVDQNTNTGWFDDDLPDPPTIPGLEPEEPGVL